MGHFTFCGFLECRLFSLLRRAAVSHHEIVTRIHILKISCLLVLASHIRSDRNCLAAHNWSSETANASLMSEIVSYQASRGKHWSLAHLKVPLIVQLVSLH